MRLIYVLLYTRQYMFQNICKKKRVHKRRSFMNMLLRNLVTSEMSDDVGKTFRAIYSKLFFPSIFQKYASTFSTNPDSVCVFWTNPLPHRCFEYWVISAKVLEISPSSRVSKHFVAWPSADAYMIVRVQSLSDTITQDWNGYGLRSFSNRARYYFKHSMDLTIHLLQI
jgi:hypothetical protein